MSSATTVTANTPPNYPDIRVRVCPDAGRVNLAKYIATTDNITSLLWTSRISSIKIDSPDGAVFTNSLNLPGTYTFTYTVTSQCVAVAQERKVYLEVLKGGRMRPLKDTIAICHLHAEAVNINQLFGIEANGVWEYPSYAVKSHISESTSPNHCGAVVMNGKAIYNDNQIPFGSYRGLINKVKFVKFTYKTDGNSCLKGKTYSMVIALIAN